jgi:hypothetical protein
VNRPLGLHCLLYVSADRILPNSGRRGGTDTSVWMVLNSMFKTSVSVPCLPTVEVVQRDLESRLLMAAVLECWEMGRVKLRLAEPSDTRWKGYFGSGYGRVHVVPLAGPALDGLCGRILERLERKGEQGAEQLLRTVINSNARGGSVITKIESELADHGYMRHTVVRKRRGGRKVQPVVDCERIRTLEEACALAVDRWNRAWAADPRLCHALLIDCTEPLVPQGGGG